MSEWPKPCDKCDLTDDEVTFVRLRGDKRPRWQHRVCPRDRELQLELVEVPMT